MSNIPCIALVGNAPSEKYAVLNALLGEEELGDICDVILYGADGQAEDEALQDALDDFADGKIDAIACLPTATPLVDALAQSYEPAPEITTIEIGDRGRLVSIMGDMDLADAALHMTKTDVFATIKDTAATLKRDLDVLNPRIAVLSLNKEIDTDEASEECAILAPAISEAVKDRVQVFGPYASATYFDTPDFMAFDAIIQCYDEQCGEAFRKANAAGPIVKLYSGLEMPVTQAEPEDILHAIFLAAEVARRRKTYDAPFANPLPKLYQERKEDGDKARFAVKKKGGFNPAEHRRENVTFQTAKPKNEAKTE